MVYFMAFYGIIISVKATKTPYAAAEINGHNERSKERQPDTIKTYI